MITIAKKILIILLPLIVMLFVYLAFDPFEVIYKYKRHYNDPMISYNWDFNQTETLIRNYSERKYDSFIFGNSRSIAFITGDWGRFINSPRMLHFAAMNESLYGVHRKLLFLSKEQMPIHNALIILDPQLLSLSINSTGHLFMKHPSTSGESPFTFHFSFLRAFIDLPYFIGFVDYKLTGKIRPVFRKKFGESLQYNPITGDKLQVKLENSIAENSEKYYKDRSSVFYSRDFTKHYHAAAVLQEVQSGYLKDIRRILDANRADYRIVISPNYDQKYLNPKDLARLQEIFGLERVYDYSGINRFTMDMHNYYEDSHYRSLVARQIMTEVYEGQGEGGDRR